MVLVVVHVHDAAFATLLLVWMRAALYYVVVLAGAMLAAFGLAFSCSPPSVAQNWRCQWLPGAAGYTADGMTCLGKRCDITNSSSNR